MRQAIHIFRKDARHCWPYIAVAFALVALNAWHTSSHFAADHSKSVEISPIQLLLYLAWWFAIGVVVHQEGLSGDRQFWVTRPYSWKSLLAAKLSFAVIFLGLPIFLSDCVILLSRGYDPLALVPLLLWRQCCFAAAFASAFIVAAITRRTSQLALAYLLLFGATVLSVGVWLASALSGPGVAEPGRLAWLGAVSPWLAAAAGFSVIVWQYARRHRSRAWAFAAIALTVVAEGWFQASYVARGFMMSRMVYATNWQNAPRYSSVAVRLAGAPERVSPADLPFSTRGLIGIPVRFDGWPRDLIACQLGRAAVYVAFPPEFGRFGSSVPGPKLGITTTSDGRELIWLSVDDLARKARCRGKAGQVDLKIFIDLEIYERRVRADLWPGRGWTRVPGFGTAMLADDPHAGHLVRLTTVRPLDPWWTYETFSPQTAPTVEVSKPVYDPPISPAGLRMSPVYSYVRSSVAPVDSEPVFFTAERQVALLRRELIVPGVRLTDFETNDQ